MTSNVILSGLLFSFFSFCKFRRDLNSFTDTMGAEGICEQAGTKVGPDQLGPPVRVGSTRIDSDQLGLNKKILKK